MVGRWLLLTSGAAVILYCLFVLAFATTSPDLGIRCLLEDEAVAGARPGPQIRRVKSTLRCMGKAPDEGDVLMEIGVASLRNF